AKDAIKFPESRIGCKSFNDLSAKGISNNNSTARTIMPATNQQNGASRAAIFVRLWETEDGRLPLPLARHILKLGFPKPDKARMHELAVKNQQGLISPSELEELDNYI